MKNFLIVYFLIFGAYNTASAFDFDDTINCANLSYIEPLKQKDWLDLVENFKRGFDDSKKLGAIFGVEDKMSTFSKCVEACNNEPWPCRLPKKCLIKGGSMVWRGQSIVLGFLFLRIKKGMFYAPPHSDGMYFIHPPLPKRHTPSIQATLIPKARDKFNQHSINIDGIFSKKNARAYTSHIPEVMEVCRTQRIVLGVKFSPENVLYVPPDTFCSWECKGPSSTNVIQLVISPPS